MGSAVSGDSLFMARWGDGPDVVFLHGLGASSRYWQPLAAASSGYRATAPDLLGFGRSPSPPDASYDVDCHLGALMPQLPRRAVVVAHSTGTILAAALAARHPDRVASMVLVALPAYPDEEAARRSIGALGLLARLTVDRVPAARWVCETMGRFRPLAVAVAPWVVRDLPPSIASDGARHTWPSYSGTLRRVVVGHRAVDDLRQTPTPVTLLHGRHDRTAPLHFVQALAEGASPGQSRLHLKVVEGEHHLAVRRPGVVGGALAPALDRANGR